MSARRRAIEKQSEAEQQGQEVWLLAILTLIAGGVGCAGFFQAQDPPWPRVFAFGWFAVFATGLVIELGRRRRVARRAVAARARRTARR